MFAADIKGDLSGLAAAGTPSDKLAARTAALGQQWSARAFPTEFYALGDDVGSGIPVRARCRGSVRSCSAACSLERHAGVELGLVFHYADEKGLALVDLSDLRAC